MGVLLRAAPKGALYAHVKGIHHKADLARFTQELDARVTDDRQGSPRCQSGA